LGESRRPSILQLGWRSDPRPDDTGDCRLTFAIRGGAELPASAF
jgi:hypothetical protein